MSHIQIHIYVLEHRNKYLMLYYVKNKDLGSTSQWIIGFTLLQRERIRSHVEDQATSRALGHLLAIICLRGADFGANTAWKLRNAWRSWPDAYIPRFVQVNLHDLDCIERLYPCYLLHLLDSELRAQHFSFTGFMVVLIKNHEVNALWKISKMRKKTILRK